MAEFDWEDNRQSVMEVLDGTTVQVQIEREQRDFSGRVQIPVTDNTFAAYLGEDQFIQPYLPQVQDLVEEILQGETDGWQATQRIVDWVFQFMKDEMVVQTLTTAEILEGRAGKCSEYAILFASLARAAGIPTRIALGERYQGNLWIGHMWNEVWLGEWVAVDASHNQAAPDALLLKFVDSETVLGTQDVRQGLIGKLDITIDNVEVAPMQTGRTLEPGIQGQIYRNGEYACEITIPEGWIGIEATDQGMPMIVMQDPTVPDQSALLLMMSLPPGILPEQLMESRIAVMPTALPGFALVHEGNTTLSEDSASFGRWTFEDESKFVQENWIVIREDVGYLFVFTAPEAAWPEFEARTREILASFVSYR